MRPHFPQFECRRFECTHFECTRSGLRSRSDWNSLASAALLVVAVGFASGCASTKTSNTSRTAMEQLLISNAIDQSLDKIDFRPLAGENVYLDTSYIESVDKNYLIASMRSRILQNGGRIVPKAEEATVVVEARSGGIGTDQSEVYLGIPEFAVPGPMPISTPEIKFWSKNTQTGTAKLGIVAYDPGTKQILGQSGTTLARSDDSNTYVFGLGPWQSGTVRQEVHRNLSTGPRYSGPQAIALCPPPSRNSDLQLAGGEGEPAGHTNAQTSEYREVPAAPPAEAP